MMQTSLSIQQGCPIDFPCECKEISVEEDIYITINCKHKGLLHVPDLSPLRNKWLFVLDLSHNNIQFLPDNTFYGLYFKKYLLAADPQMDLAHNPLSRIGDNAFNNVQTEDFTLSLEYTELTESPMEQIKKLSNLTGLFMSNTKITHISDNSFTSLNKIRYLDLSNNKIGDIGQEFLNGLEDSLTYIELKGIGMTTFPTKALGIIKDIYEIKLNHNSIQHLSAHLFEGFPTYKNGKALLDISMSGNPIKSISPLSATREQRLKLVTFN